MTNDVQWKPESVDDEENRHLLSYAKAVREFAEKAFSYVNLNYKDHIIIDKNLIRPAEVSRLLADYSKAKKRLKWKPDVSFENLVKDMVESDLDFVKNFKY